MRVAIIVSAIKQLGPVKVIETLVNSGLKHDDIQIDVYHLDKIIDPEIHMSVSVKYLNVRSFHFEDYDIIHTSGIRPDFFAFLYRRRIRYHISTIHNFVFEDLKYSYNRFISFFFGFFWIMLWRRADKLVCVSDSQKEFYRKWFRADKLIVIYNSIPESLNANKPDDDVVQKIHDFRLKGLKIIGTICILTKIKGLDQVLDLIAHEKKYSFIVIGDGKEYFNLIRLAKRLGIISRCCFCGFKSSAAKYLQYIDFYIMPSRSEGFGISLIEAVQNKVPVICSDIIVFKELFSSDEVSFFKLDDLTSLIQAMNSAEESGIEKVGRAYERYINNYTSVIMAKCYFDLYQSHNKT